MDGACVRAVVAGTWLEFLLFAAVLILQRLAHRELEALRSRECASHILSWSRRLESQLLITVTL